MNRLPQKNSRVKRAWIKWKNLPLGDKVFLTIVYSLIGLITLSIIYPVWWTIIASVSEPNDVADGKVIWFPSGFTLEAYELIFENELILQAYGNTIFYTVVGTLFNLFLTLPLAYAWSRQRLFGRGALSTFFLITMYFGGGMIPQFVWYRELGLYNTRLLLILHSGLSIHNTILVRTYFQHNIPETLYESARIDGASEFRVFLTIALPLSLSIIAVVTLYYAVSRWGSWFGAMIYTTDVKLQPLQLLMRNILMKNQQILQGADEDLLWDTVRRNQLAETMKFGIVIVSCIPMIVAYPFVQKHFVRGRMAGSVKG